MPIGSWRGLTTIRLLSGESSNLTWWVVEEGTSEKVCGHCLIIYNREREYGDKASNMLTPDGTW